MKSNNKYTQLKILVNQNPNWKIDPELALIDTILQELPQLEKLIETDYKTIKMGSKFGRQDSPSLEQVLRAVIYMKIKRLTYSELHYHQDDSRICSHFLHLELLNSKFSISTWQKYISCIQPETVEKILLEIGRFAYKQGFDSLKMTRIDSTTIESIVHYPTNNSLLWDCIKESHNLLARIPQKVIKELKLNFRNNKKQAKINLYLLNNMKRINKKYKLTFQQQLHIYDKSINQLNLISEKVRIHFSTMGKDDKDFQKLANFFERLSLFLENATKVRFCCQQREIEDKKVENSEKVFSIYEPHTNIIVKGSRNPTFGHKVNLITGKSSLIFGCEILKGNPSDSTLFTNTIDSLIDNYGKTPNSVVTDGGYASLANMKHAKSKGICNIVFSKIVGSLKNSTSSKQWATKLKKWRSGIEANISNLKRGFNLRRVKWKGFNGFSSDVLWSVIAYNFRILTTILVRSL